MCWSSVWSCFPLSSVSVTHPNSGGTDPVGLFSFLASRVHVCSAVACILLFQLWLNPRSSCSLIQWLTPWELPPPYSKKMLLTCPFPANNPVASFLCFTDCALGAHLKICFLLVFFKSFVEVSCMGGTKHLWVTPS